jgi:hypothetical protein
MVLINEMVSLFDFLKLCFILICNICIARCMYFCGFGFVLFCWCGFSSLLSRHILFINSVGVSFVDLHTLVDLRFLPPFIYEIPNQTQTLHFLLQYHPSSFSWVGKMLFVVDRPMNQTNGSFRVKRVCLNAIIVETLYAQGPYSTPSKVFSSSMSFLNIYQAEFIIYKLCFRTSPSSLI